MTRADTLRLALLTGVLAVVAGCHLDDSLPAGTDPSGSLRVVAVLPRSLPPESAVAVEGSFTAAGGQAQPLSLTEPAVAGESWHLLARGLSAGEGGTLRVRAAGEGGGTLGEVVVSDVVLLDHHPALVVVVPHPTPPTEGPASPFIDAVVAPRAAVPPGEPMKLRVQARAPEAGVTLTYAWSASAGTLEEATSATPTWTAPEKRGVVTFTVRVSDPGGATSTLEFGVNVEVGGGWGLDVPATLNRAPLVPEVGAGPAEQARPGEPLAIQAVGLDEDSDSLTFAWSATCEGSFADASAAQTTFTPTSLPTGACDNCRLSVVVRDSQGARNERSVDVCVRTVLPPEITATSQSATRASSAELVKLSVSARDPYGEPLTFAWTTNLGLVSRGSREGDTSLVEWTELSCIPAGAEPTITVTVRNASGLTATHAFPVTWASTRCGEHPPCSMSLESERVTLTADCTTEQTVRIPDGFTFDGDGHTLTAVDPREGHFTGAVLTNQGLTAHVVDVKVTARGLAEQVCDAGAARLRGILFEGATGSIVDSEVVDIHQKEGQGACQEGVAIDVRAAAGATLTPSVDIRNNRVAGFQKAGIAAVGQVMVNVEGNLVDGGGQVATVARNGIQFSSGATGRVVGNEVRGHAYTGPDWTSAGILVAGGPKYGTPLCEDIVIRGNTLADNDVGIDLAQSDVDGSPLDASTNIEVVDNTLTHARAVKLGHPYQAGISDLGGANRISQNRFDGPGYSRATQPGVTFDVDVEAASASRLAFLSPRHDARVRECSAAVVVQSQDGVGNLSALASPSLRVEAMGSATADLALYRDAACGDAIPRDAAGWSLALTAPQHEAVFYFRASQPGTVMLTVTGDGVSTNQEHTVR